MTVSNQPQQPNTERVRDLLSPYLDGEVTAEERALVEQAMAASPQLRQELETLRQTVLLVGELPPAPAPRPFTLSESDVQPAKAPSGRGFIFPSWLRSWAMLAATLLCVLAIGGVFLSQQFLGGISSLAPDEIARVEEPAAAPEMAMEAEPAQERPATEEGASAEMAVEITEAPAEAALEKEETIIVEVEREQEAPAEEAAETGAMMAGEAEVAVEEGRADKASEIAEGAAPEEDTIAGDAVMATPSPAPTMQAFAIPSATPTTAVTKAVSGQEAPAEPGQPAPAEEAPLAAEAEQEAAADQNLAQSEAVEPPTPSVTPQPTPTAVATVAAAPSPEETTLTLAPTATGAPPLPEVTPPVPRRTLAIIFVVGLVIIGGSLAIGLLVWFLARKRRS